MRTIVLVVPGSIAQRSGGYEYDRRMAAGLRARGWNVEIKELAGAFPHPSTAELDGAARALATIRDATTVVVDGLAFGAMPAQVEHERARLCLVALVHLPLADHIGIDRGDACQLADGERRALAAARGCIVTGAATAGALERYGVARERIALVEPGTDPAPLARGSRDPLHLVSVAAITPGKGHETLLRAAARVRERPWRLTCAGSVERHPQTAARVRELLHEERLETRVALVGEIGQTALSALYDVADVFVHASLHETYGMVVAEALARGIPVVGSATGAIPALIGADAGVLVPPGDIDALAAALGRLVDDSDLRLQLAAGARRMRDRLPTWEAAAGRMAAALTSLETNGLFAR